MSWADLLWFVKFVTAGGAGEVLVEPGQKAGGMEDMRTWQASARP